MPASRAEPLAPARGDAAAPPARGTGSVWIPFAAGLLYSLLTALSFPPVGVWPAAFVAIVPLGWVGVRSASATAPAPGRRFRWLRGLRTPLLVTLGVLPLHLYENQWLINVTGLGYVPCALILSAFVGAFVWLVTRIHQRFPRIPLALVIPLVWTGVELFRGEVFFTGYPWLFLAHPLIDAAPLAAPATVLGTYFVSFLAAAVNAIIVEAAMVRPLRPLQVALASAATLAGFFVVPLLGRTPAPPAGTFRIAVVQTNVPQDNKLDWTIDQRLSDFDRFFELTRQAAAVDPRPDLIVWPETMFPGVFLDPAGLRAVEDAEARIGKPLEGLTFFAERLVRLQAELGIPMLVGAVGYDNPRLAGAAESLDLKSDARFNSVFLLSRGEIDPLRYDKIVLTPFGEVMPYISSWPWLEKQIMAVAAQGMAFDLTAGSRPRDFRIPSTLSDRPEVVIATPICFEATKAGLCRRLLQSHGNNPRILLNLTNDGWFGRFDSTRLQYLQIARWRALELATPLVRAANTGISTWIDARGSVIKAGIETLGPATRVDGILIADTRPSRTTTIYAQVGDVFGWSAMAFSIALGVISFTKPRNSRGPKRVEGSASAAA